MSTKSFMGANKMNSLSELFATSFLLHLNSQDLRKMTVSYQLWSSWGFLGEVMIVSTVWIWIQCESELHCVVIMTVVLFGGGLKYVTYNQQSASWFNEFGLLSLYKYDITQWLLLKLLSNSCKTTGSRPFPCIKELISTSATIPIQVIIQRQYSFFLQC